MIDGKGCVFDVDEDLFLNMSIENNYTWRANKVYTIKPIGSMYGMVYLPTFTIKINQM